MKAPVGRATGALARRRVAAAVLALFSSVEGVPALAAQPRFDGPAPYQAPMTITSATTAAPETS